METQPYGVTVHGPGEFSVKWPRMKPGITGQPYETDERQIHSIDVDGTFNNTIGIVLLGSDDGNDCSPLVDYVGRVVEVQHPGSRYVGTTPKYVRPVVSSIDGRRACRPVSARTARPCPSTS